MFIDTEFLKIGDDWESTINEKIEESDFFIFCISEKAVKKIGFIQKELRVATELQKMLPGESAFILPLRLDECLPPQGIKQLHYRDWHRNEDTKQLNQLIQDIVKHSHDIHNRMK